MRTAAADLSTRAARRSSGCDIEGPIRGDREEGAPTAGTGLPTAGAPPTGGEAVPRGEGRRAGGGAEENDTASSMLGGTGGEVESRPSPAAPLQAGDGEQWGEGKGAPGVNGTGGDHLAAVEPRGAGKRALSHFTPAHPLPRAGDSETAAGEGCAPGSPDGKDLVTEPGLQRLRLEEPSRAGMRSAGQDVELVWRAWRALVAEMDSERTEPLVARALNPGPITLAKREWPKMRVSLSRSTSSGLAAASSG